MHNLRLILFALVFSIFISGYSQALISWKDLEDVEYEFDYIEGLNTWYGKPTFGPSAKALDGKKIIITGYIIPLDLTGGNYMLSAYPYQSCFFCGGAGQESIIDLKLASSSAKFVVDQQATFIGTLRLNDKELEMSYILENAKVQDTPN